MLGASLVAQKVKNPPVMQEILAQSPGWENPLENRVFLPGEFHEQRSLAGYNPWGCREVDRTEQLTLSLSHSE